MISLELPRSGEGIHEVLACIVHVMRQGDKWALGCVFSRELSAEDLEGFGAKKVRPCSSFRHMFKAHKRETTIHRLRFESAG